VGTIAAIPRLRHRLGAPAPARRPRTAARARRDAIHAAHLPPRAPASPSRRPSPGRDRGSALLIVFMSGTLAMVGLVRLIDIVDRAWILIAVLVVYAIVIGAVIASVLRVMDDNDDGD
jgi:hypothetical protein